MITAHQRGVCVVAVSKGTRRGPRRTRAPMPRAKGYPTDVTTEPEMKA